MVVFYHIERLAGEGGGFCFIGAVAQELVGGDGQEGGHFDQQLVPRLPLAGLVIAQGCVGDCQLRGKVFSGDVLGLPNGYEGFSKAHRVHLSSRILLFWAIVKQYFSQNEQYFSGMGLTFACFEVE